jgi:integrase
MTTASKRPRATTIRTILTRAIVLKLKREDRPVGVDAKGIIRFAPNTSTDDYIVWDGHSDAPAGFGVRVSARKTYVLRRKVNGVSRTVKVGNVSDFLDLSDARARASTLALQVQRTGKNPNVESRKAVASEATVMAIFSEYREHLRTRTGRPVKASTLRVVDKVIRKFDTMQWCRKKVNDIEIEDIRAEFKRGNGAPTANEQRFRWAIAAVNWKIESEVFAARAGNRQPTLTVNPFSILVSDKAFRSRGEIEQALARAGARNPLKPSSTLGPFLEAAWSKKNSNDNETGVHYLILMLLWGCRQAEHAQCEWGDKLREHGEHGVGRTATSHVWLRERGDYLTNGPYVFFHNTKNGSSHRLPIGTMALELLRRRQVSAAEEAVRRGFDAKSSRFVFPAKHKTSRSGHYSSAQDLLGRIKAEAGIERLNRHDLRRSFGTVMTSINVPESIKSRFFNHAKLNVTDRYTEAEWSLLREWMERIEQAILINAPNIYNSVKPADWPPLPAPDPHVCRPPAPRSGRPKRVPAAITL